MARPGSTSGLTQVGVRARGAIKGQLGWHWAVVGLCEVTLDQAGN
jgi:hypothetical protein